MQKRFQIHFLKLYNYRIHESLDSRLLGRGQRIRYLRYSRKYKECKLMHKRWKSVAYWSSKGEDCRNMKPIFLHIPEESKTSTKTLGFLIANFDRNIGDIQMILKITLNGITL